METMIRRLITMFLTGSLWLCAVAADHLPNKDTMIDWNGSLMLPPADGTTPNIGVAGAFAGIASGKLMIAGGANFPDGFPWTGATKIWHNTLYMYDFASAKWSVYDDYMPEPIAYGVSIGLPDGVMLIGGNNALGPVKSVYFLTETNGAPMLNLDMFPELPVPLSSAAGALVGRKVYLAGGVTNAGPEEASHTFLMLDLDNIEGGWHSLEPWPGTPLGYAVAAEADGKFYLFSGRDFGPGRETIPHKEGYCYDPVSGQWHILNGTFPFMAGTAVGIDNDIWFFGGVREILPTDPHHPGFPRSVCRYNPHTEELDTVAESPFPIAVTTTAVYIAPDKVIIASGEEKPGVRTPLVLQCTIDNP